MRCSLNGSSKHCLFNVLSFIAFCTLADNMLLVQSASPSFAGRHYG